MQVQATPEVELRREDTNVCSPLGRSRLINNIFIRAFWLKMDEQLSLDND